MCSFKLSRKFTNISKEDYPELYVQIKQRIAEGRWEVDGAMWVEADCNLPSGESLIRQILYGKSLFARNSGEKAPISGCRMFLGIHGRCRRF